MTDFILRGQEVCKNFLLSFADEGNFFHYLGSFKEP
jgi:hypothetical protein